MYCLYRGVLDVLQCGVLYTPGAAVPTGCSISHVAAHWTPNGGDKTVPFFFFFTLVAGPRRSLSLKLSDKRVYEP